MSEATVIIKGRMDDLKLYRDVLADQGIDAQIINPDCQTSSWGTKLSLAVASDDVPQAAAALEANWRSQLSEDEQKAADIVLDFEAEEMTCPACLTTFATGPKECPDCGLFLGA